MGKKRVSDNARLALTKKATSEDKREKKPHLHCQKKVGVV